MALWQNIPDRDEVKRTAADQVKHEAELRMIFDAFPKAVDKDPIVTSSTSKRDSDNP
jgi:hypothetical protein